LLLPRSSRRYPGVWLTALQLGNSQRNFLSTSRHQPRSDSGTLNRIVVRPAVWLMMPPVVKSRKRKVAAVIRLLAFVNRADMGS
jgi:hypothetical protein